ncbi:MAG: TetR/AcrR family transcriptional regulator [Bacteroidales bacterium]|jgi:AcrR family transcriptional regulator|nr:TetR/AcrR family transcriptional regulator [Bacteroidales bacterium]
MPKTSSITKEMIIDAAFEIVRADGFTAISARNIAKKMGCSTQPIYWTYENMEVLKQDVITKILQFLSVQIGSYTKTGKPFLDLGLGYIHVAFTESVLFKSLCRQCAENKTDRHNSQRNDDNCNEASGKYVGYF